MDIQTKLFTCFVFYLKYNLVRLITVFCPQCVNIDCVSLALMRLVEQSITLSVTA